MARFDVQASAKTKAEKRAKADPVLKDLLTKGPDEITAWWGAAKDKDKDELLLQLLLLVIGTTPA